MVIGRNAHAVYDTKYYLVWPTKYQEWIQRKDIRAATGVTKTVLEARSHNPEDVIEFLTKWLDILFWVRAQIIARS